MITTVLSAQTTDKHDPKTFGITKNIPVFCQEWHVWWGFSYTHPHRAMSHMTTRLTSDMQPWRMQWDRNGYPYVGIYDSTNEDVIRWQMQCMKAAGLDATVVMIHPEMSEGITFLNEDQLLLPILDLAAEQKYSIFYMDEVAFRKGSICRDPKIMAQRIIRFLKIVKDHPGFLKIDGKPVYYYQTFGYWPGVEATTQMMATVEKEVGEVYWMIFGDVNQVSQVPQVDAIISSASVHRTESRTRIVDMSQQDPAKTIAVGHKANKKVGDMIYPKFDGTAQPWRQKQVSAYGKAARMLQMHIAATMEDKPDFLMLSSWNDYEEGANLEPAWDIDGLTDDPFLYCRMLAHLRGKTFNQPANPPKESVIPMVWEKLGYGDGAGPIIDRVYRSHQRGGAMWVDVRDTVSPVTALEVAWEGDRYWKAAQPGENKDTGNIKLTEGEVGPAYAQQGLLGDFQIGSARELLTTTQTFDLGSTASELGVQPWIGAAWAFEPTNPRAGVSIQAKSVNEIVLSEPKGQLRTHQTIKLIPANKPREISEQVWTGWQSMVGMPPRAVDWQKESTLQLIGRGRKLAILSVLGQPRSSRLIDVAPEKHDEKGLNVTYRFEIPDHVLDTPGVHFAWIRAQDAAGNWGSPKLVPVPNYERPWDELKEPLVETTPLDASSDSVVADDMQDKAKWKGKAAIERLTRIEDRSVLVVKNTVITRKLDQPITGSFTLTMDMLHTNYQRGGIVVLLDNQLKQGYGLLWDSSNEKYHNGEGAVGLLKYDLDKPFVFGSRGQSISPRVSSGHVAVQQPLAKMRLIYDAKSGDINLWVDGKLKVSGKDKQFTKFNQLLIRGNTSQLYDNVILRPGVHE
ncbi:MAG: hypothetical protein CMJ19_03625 [Phycisphaeraceae bacterium]|nr:hypothetical protein [Phycisphaeraceae bacterium]